MLGQIDRCEPDIVEGWLFGPASPEHRIVLQVYVGNLLVGECRAEIFRQDLLDAGFGDGACAFRFPFATRLSPAATREVRLRIVGTPAFLLAVPPGRDAAAHVSSPSAFGHLWVDRSDFMDQLGLRHRRGDLDEEQCGQLARFVRDGFLLIPNAVPPRAVVALNEEIERLWQRPPEGLMIETFEPDDQMKYIRPDIALRNGRTKLLDPYAQSQVVRRATATVPVAKFLGALFGEQPKAFQQAALWRGIQQPMHKDSAYVRVTSNPLAMAGAWLALEDVAQGAGELEYLVGSHRGPEFLFGGTSKWVQEHADDHERFERTIQADAETHGHRRGAFLARAGDVLIYHADLANGCARVTRPNATRRTLLTHFTGVSEQPAYIPHTDHAGMATDACMFVSEFAPVT